MELLELLRRKPRNPWTVQPALAQQALPRHSQMGSLSQSLAVLEWPQERGTAAAGSVGTAPDGVLLPEAPDFHLLLGLSPAATTHQRHRQAKDYRDGNPSGAFHAADSLCSQAMVLKALLLFKPTPTTHEVNTQKPLPYLVSQAALSLSQR